MKYDEILFWWLILNLILKAVRLILWDFVSISDDVGIDIEHNS